jgi:hypothetical protein
MVLAASCGGAGDGGQSGGPTAPTSNGPQAWTLAGRVIDSLSGEPVGGAAVTIDGRPASTTDAHGRWVLEASGAAQPVLSAGVLAQGFVPRETFINWQSGGRTDVTLEIIPERAPFLLSFYRALVRNGLEEPSSLQPVRRWTSNPNFYIRTLNPKTGRPLEPQELEILTGTIRQAVPQLTGGLLSAGAIETGADAREPRPGFINVTIVYEPSEDYCGRALVGVNPGEVEINYDRCADTCGSSKIAATAIAHEIGHALGFWHVDRGIMTAVISNHCANVLFTEQERVHARLAYRRPAGNSDPDRDPTTFASIETAAAPRVACALRPR